MRPIMILLILLVAGPLIATQMGSSVDIKGAPLPTAPSVVVTDAPPEATEPAPSGQSEDEAPTAQDVTHTNTVLTQFLCTNCHRLDSGWKLTRTHAETTQSCEACHAPAPEPASAITVHFVPDDTATQALCALCHGDIIRADPPPVAPVIPQAQACVSCHADDEEGHPPNDHEGRSVITCDLCHQTTTLSAGVIPHDTKGWEDCDFCHGTNRLTPLGDAHRDIPKDECTNCHESVETPQEMPKRMLHYADAIGRCTSCHRADKLGPLPVSHETFREETCVLCHTQ